MAIVLELGDEQVETLIRDMRRSVALLDLLSRDAEDDLRRHACLHQGVRLADFAQELEDRWVGRYPRVAVARR